MKSSHTSLAFTVLKPVLQTCFQPQTPHKRSIAPQANETSSFSQKKHYPPPPPICLTGLQLTPHMSFSLMESDG